MKGSYTIDEDFYIFVKILRLLNSIQHKNSKLNDDKIEIIRIAVKKLDYKEMINRIYNTLIT